MIPEAEMRQKCKSVVSKFEQRKAQLHEDVNKEYYETQNQPNGIDYEEYQEMLQQINYDIAWQIFDEVNQQNNIDSLVDLSCLDVQDASAICKQVIYDAGVAVRDGGKNVERVLCITCGEDQIS